MSTTLVLHVLAGCLGVLSGFVALYAAKGEALHRRSGMIFVGVMLAASSSGALIAVVRGVAPAINIPAGLLTAYLVTTALLTVRPAFAGSRRLETVAMLVAFAVGFGSLLVGVQLMASGNARQVGLAFPLLMFGIVGVIAGVGDYRMIRAGGIAGMPRIARHLWRMCFALLIASLSFFVGQASVFPKALRIPGLLALPVLAVLVTMIYWLWRVRVRKTFRGVVGVRG